MKKHIITAILMIAFQNAFSQEGDHLIKWNFSFENKILKAGDEVPLVCEAKIDNGWSLFVTDYDTYLGIKSIEFEFAENGTFGVIKPVLPLNKSFQNECSQNEKMQNIAENVTFRTLVRIEENKFEVSGIVRGQLIHQKTGQSVSFQKKFIVQ
jgi:hypothetical protein